MLLAGDENGRTQNGNNNAYCQDNELSWFDWEQAQSPQAKALACICRATAAAAARISAPCAAAISSTDGSSPGRGMRDIEWFDEKGKTMRPEDWQYGEGRTAVRAPSRAPRGRANRGQSSADQQYR